MHTSKIMNFITILKKYYFFLKHEKKMRYHAKYLGQSPEYILKFPKKTIFNEHPVYKKPMKYNIDSFTKVMQCSLIRDFISHSKKRSQNRSLFKEI